MTIVFHKFFPANAEAAVRQGGEKVLRAVETYKKQSDVSNYPFFSSKQC